jgi:hypothetical protein
MRREATNKCRRLCNKIHKKLNVHPSQSAKLTPHVELLTFHQIKLTPHVKLLTFYHLKLTPHVKLLTFYHIL